MEKDEYQNTNFVHTEAEDTGDGHTEQLFSGMSTAAYMKAMADRSKQTENSNMYYQPYTNTNQSRSEDGREQKKARKKQHAKNRKNSAPFWKRCVAIAASAALFGGVAGGVFNYIAGDTIREYNNASKQVSEDTKTGVTLAQVATTEALGMTQTSTANYGMDVSAIAENVMPSVVAINVSAIVEQPSFFGYMQQYQAEGSGSGIIVGENDSELLIVTNNHVVSDATDVNVCFFDGESYEAKVKGTDSDNDLAIIVVDLEDISQDTMSKLKIATIGDSDAVKVGEQVVAIGNALGYGQSVTTGIVSAKDRMNDTNETPLIQTDAAINPGNSGGALLNMKGEVIGINSSKYSDTTVEGMGYAIPITAVQDILNNLMNRETREKVSDKEKGYLGISCGTVSSEISEAYGIPTGVIVSEVQSDSAAKKAGIKKNDVITKVDGLSVSSAEDLTEKLSYYKAGETIPVTYEYLDGEDYVEKTVDVTLGKNPNHN